MLFDVLIESALLSYDIIAVSLRLISAVPLVSY